MIAHLHFAPGTAPFPTVRVPHKDAPLWWQERGLNYTASGYGNRIPSRHMVRWQGRWRRVYVCQYSNAGTAYIGKPGAWLATVSID
jgi:hypothetical protein